MSNPNDPPLDEIQWRSPMAIQQMGGLHNNTILFYFAESPFFERTSNNAVVYNQAMNVPSMYPVIQTREAFETHLNTMSGLEFRVVEEPAETGPGAGTGVWVIRKQTRRKSAYDDDEITVHATYFVVGENIYMAPTLSAILSARILTISSQVTNAVTTAESVRKWGPSMGNFYQLPSAKTSTKPRIQNSAAATPMPVSDETSKGPAAHAAAAQKDDEKSLERLAEESFMIHMKYGGEYIDENPITGRPGEFHLTTTGRKPPQIARTDGPIRSINAPTINTKIDDKKESKESKEKTPKSATAPKPKRKKSKMVNSTSTPAAS
ncbi:RNA polymerase II transcriptional regulation mediator MED6 [Fusarium tjaetaba]|uniref:Mediator of RNA polymerase II transcription subunit 6 n=1 Tax=Fusarium tjaetaba TaxID=1567544 RepID=A0A8H5VMX5_9HYPO|nr:RNA polymerase II transcriptional regulation mediator MED6 [Fusarium tjaetaba]KAF5628068.1 RNA polymerase II transcriptional regulation mediator MED6 [Fusarium tjaetaba]